MAKPDIWMPWYINDYLGDTMHLTRDEHGGYLLLIAAYWKLGGPLPDDPVSLASIAKAALSEWLGGPSTPVERSLSARLSPFFEIRDGKWFHKRVDKELLKAKANIEQKIRAGLASANARSNARSTDVPTHVPTALPTERQRNVNASPSPSPSPSKTPESSPRAISIGGANASPPLSAYPNLDDHEHDVPFGVDSTTGEEQFPPAPPPPPQRRHKPAIPPPIADVIACGVQIALPETECHAWFDHFTANGWKVGRNPMKDWRASLRTWHRNWRAGTYSKGPHNGQSGNHSGNHQTPADRRRAERSAKECDENLTL